MRSALIANGRYKQETSSVGGSSFLARTLRCWCLFHFSFKAGLLKPRQGLLSKWGATGSGSGPAPGHAAIQTLHGKELFRSALITLL